MQTDSVSVPPSVFQSVCLEWGLECDIQDRPVNRFAAAESPRPAAGPTTPPPAQLGTPPRFEPKRNLPKQPDSHPEFQDIDALDSYLRDYKGLDICRTATHTLCGRGVPSSRIFIAELCPSIEADLSGQVFGGPRGQLLSNILRSIGLSLEQTYSSYIFPWRPPGERRPTDAEIQIVAPLFQQRLRLTSPETVLLFGKLTTDIYHASTLEPSNFKVISLPSLSYFLRSPRQKDKIWQKILQQKSSICLH